MSPSPLVQDLILAGVKIAVVVGTLLGLFSLMTWIERRTLAFMQYRLGPNRTGPLGILQPIADGIKLFFKEEVMPAAADKWAFLAAPVVAVATALLAVAVVPYGPPFTLPSWGLLPEFLRGRTDADPDRQRSTWGCCSSSRSPRSASTGSCSPAGRPTTSTACSGGCAPRPRCSPTSSPSA